MTYCFLGRAGDDAVLATYATEHAGTERYAGELGPILG